MMNRANSTLTKRQNFLCADLHLTLCHWGRLARKGPSFSDGVFSSTHAKLLDFQLTHRKHRTSHFLIDNFGALFLLCPPKQILGKKSPASSIEPRAFRTSNRQYTKSESAVSHRKQRIGGFLIANSRALFLLRTRKHVFAKAGPPRRTSNRPSPRLELLVTYSKQRIELISNRPKIAFVNLALNSRRPCVSPS